uniref:GK21374 n=1 Tax=Drosophila willistoni TaxID=7260 RepID=B4MQU7_DROWI
MYHNFVLVLLLLASGLCLINGLGNSGGNDYTWGTKTTASTLIADVIVTKTKSLMSTTTQTYALTQSGTALTITYIQITDLKKMRGATAAITSGGVGSTTVDLDVDKIETGTSRVNCRMAARVVCHLVECPDSRNDTPITNALKYLG